MNYGKSNLSRRKKQISSKKKRKKKRVGVRFFKALIICFLLLIVIGAAGIGIYVKKVIDNTPEVTAKDIMPQGYTTNIVDSNGTLLEQLKDSDSNRVYKKYDEISPYMGKAFVAIEDERFYKHNGIDIQGIIRAGVNGVAHGFHFTEGASTLTQQLIKNNIFAGGNEDSFGEKLERKLQEQYLALQLEKIMDKEITRCKRYRRPCSLILFDIDFFKQINDKYGHDGGDHCLISLAQALRQQLRAQDAMGRWGGEEFLILLPETTQQQALQVADKLRQSIEQNPIRYRQLRIPVSITAGVVEYDLHSELDACIEKADKALYQGKQGGRNRCIAAVQLVSEWQQN